VQGLLAGVIKTLKIKRGLHGCAVAVLSLHRIFGIKSRIVKENKIEKESVQHPP